jgi:hypothetical protein
VRDGKKNSPATESSHQAKVSNGGDRRRETVKRTHTLWNEAHRAKVSNGGDRWQEMVKRTHCLSDRSHRAELSNGADRRRDGEENSPAIESSPSAEG